MHPKGLRCMDFQPHALCLYQAHKSPESVQPFKEPNAYEYRAKGFTSSSDAPLRLHSLNFGYSYDGS